MTYWINFWLVMLAVGVADVCWTLYIIATEKRHPISAGIWSAFIMLVGAFTVTKYVDDPSFAIAAAIGAFIGTAGIVAWKRHKESKVS